jgi:hypothetical protein
MWLPAFFAATLMSHLVVGVFAVYAAVVIWLIRGPLRTAKARRKPRSWWSGPAHRGVDAAARGDAQVHDRHAVRAGEPHRLLGSGTTSYFDWLFISEHWFLFPLVIVAIVGGSCIGRLDARRRRHRRGGRRRALLLGRPARRLGKAPAWNLRLLPFWYIMLYVGAGSAPPRSCASPRGSAGGVRHRGPHATRSAGRSTSPRGAERRRRRFAIDR